MSAFIMTRDISGAVMYAIPTASYVINATLTGGVPATLTTPHGYNTIFITSQYGQDVYVSNGGTAAYPASGTFTVDTNNTELNPTIRQIDPRGGEVISFLSRDTTDVFVRFDKIGA